MAVQTSVAVTLEALESSANDLGTALQKHLAQFSADYATGTGDSQFDLAWSDQRTLAAASEDIDLAGSLTKAIGGTFTAVEIGVIYIRNRATVAASRLTVGNGTNPAITGLVGAAAHTFRVPAGGIFLWVAPYDGGGLTVTAGSADVLKIDAGAATITYDIVVLGRSV